METHPVTRAGRSVSELLEDSGNCRQVIKQEQPNLLLLSASLFSEQRKLRHVLDWAHSFLSSGSEVHREFCRADSSIMADEEQKKSPAYEHTSASECHHPVSCTAAGKVLFGGGEGGGGGGSMQRVWHLEPSNYENSESNYHLWAYKPDPCIPLSFIPGRDNVTWPEYRETPGNMDSLEDATDKQTPSQDNICITSSLFISNQRLRSNLSDRNTNQTLASEGATGPIKASASCRSNSRHKSEAFGTVSYKTAGVQSERDKSGQQMELSKVKAEGKVGAQEEVVRMSVRAVKINEDQDSGSAFQAYAKNYRSSDEPEMTQGQMEKTSNLSFSCHLKTPTTLTVYEQYQLCVDQLHHLGVRQSQHIKPGCFIESPARERKASKEKAAPVEVLTSGFELNSSTTNVEMNKCLNKKVTAAEITKERSSAAIDKNQNGFKCSRSRATLTEQVETKHCDNFTVKETPAAFCAKCKPVCPKNNITRNTHLDLDSNKRGASMKGTAGGITSSDEVINRPMEHQGSAPGDNVPAVEETAALSTYPAVKGRQSWIEGQKTKSGGQGASLRLCEESRVSLSSLTNKEILQRPQPSGGIKHTKRHTAEDRAKPTSAYRDTHKCQMTHKPLHVDPGPTSPTAGAGRCVQTDYKYSPPCVPVPDRWLRLPDEVWLSILSLLPHSDLCRVLQVCSRLHTLATDQTLWNDLRIENSTLTERWLLCVGRRRPRSLCLYSCSGPSLSSSGLEMFFTLCRKTLKVVKVTSCIGLSLHGDQMLGLIGQRCDHVTSVDLSWSGATDAGVSALSDCCAGLHLKSVVLNGCHVTDDPLIKLVMRHKESLCRLEVFGCQFLTPSCLQAVYEMCPGLEHLNIGQVPKVNAQSLTVMTSQLKCLISLNLTGLQAVTDATVDTLVQNCVELQSLTFSSCPGVTDLTLHSICKYTPCIRSLDVSSCKAITDAGVQSLALGCKRLQQLDLSSTGTGNRGVTLLASYCSGHLHTVKLSFCHITLGNILKLCRRCKRLKVLHLYGCTHLPAEREIREVNATVKVYPLS